ncbi:thioredoxin-like domain-containing protein [Porphyromonas circumdentaria]|uniref:thioredoxin-like domain-containing protein n=1 Tax=Porphyromonas circumdentaria TaxID=29524 RepID=UPI003F654B85
MRNQILSIVKGKLFYGIALITMTLLFVACTAEKEKKGYTIVGSVEGAKDGDVVVLEAIENMNSTVVDKAVIQNGTFTFEGQQDSTVVRYLSCLTETNAFSFPFFLENGEIIVRMERGKESVTGTPTNEIYQGIRGEINTLLANMLQIESDSTLTDELREQRMDELEIEYDAILKRGMGKNISNIVGIFLFKEKYYENSLSENLRLLEKIPAQYLNDPDLQGIKKQLESQQQTDVNKPFTDLTMQTPEGKTVKLSDYIGKGKLVLVDFWASWCAPCRQSMPELIKLYNEYKGKFEIVGISLDEDKTAWEKAIVKLALPWPQMSDLKGWKSDAAMLYGIHTIPHTVLIDNEGVIVARELKGTPLAEKIAELLK